MLIVFICYRGKTGLHFHCKEYYAIRGKILEFGKNNSIQENEMTFRTFKKRILRKKKYKS